MADMAEWISDAEKSSRVLMLGAKFSMRAEHAGQQRGIDHGARRAAGARRSFFEKKNKWKGDKENLLEG